MNDIHIDGGRTFDFGRTSPLYAKYRDIYPKSLAEKLTLFGIGLPGQDILDVGSGTAVLPRMMKDSGARFTATDISENQISFARGLCEEQGVSGVSFKVCSAEKTGFPGGSFDAVTAVQCFHYFDARRAAAEFHRILRGGGRLCKVFMDWLPYEDEKIAEMERMVLKYNPSWSGGGFREFRYSFPSWAEGLFSLETVHSYNEALSFTKETWLNRVLTCRGVGASLSDGEVERFREEYSAALEKYAEPLLLKHRIHIEIYRAQ